VPGSAPVTGDDPSDDTAVEARSAFNQGLAALRPWNQSLASSGFAASWSPPSICPEHEPSMGTVGGAVSRPAGIPEQTLHLSVPSDGIRAGDVLLRAPSLTDIDTLLPAFSDPELRDAGNLPAFSREELAASLRDLPALAERGRLLPLAALDAGTGEVVGGGMLHHLDAERKIIEIGYWVFPRARGRGTGTTIARTLAEYAFSLGVERVAAYCFTREGVARSMPKPDGRRVDKTLFSLLPGE
jgi:RimJ/RimL family protein N-acetyltransferase